MVLVGSHEMAGRWREGVKRRRRRGRAKITRDCQKERASESKETGKERKVKETARMKPAAFSAGLARWGSGIVFGIVTRWTMILNCCSR